MKSFSDLRGAGTALVTPFDSNKKIDESALRKLVDFQIGEGIDFLVPCGTTGESVTLDEDEHLRVVQIVLEQSSGKVPVIAGAGGYNTAHVIHMAKKVSNLGVDGLLSVTPYYNKPTQEGLYQHFKAIADSVPTPIILYNVPGRTSTNLLPDTVVRLAEIENVCALKAASGNIAQIGELAIKIPDGFKILSGDDPNTLPIIAFGGVGVISVVSNQAPALVVKLTHLCLEGKFGEALKIQKKLFNLMKLDFIETNPIPVKAGLAMMGFIEENYRLPMVPMTEENKEKLRKCMKELGLV